MGSIGPVVKGPKPHYMGSGSRPMVPGQVNRSEYFRVDGILAEKGGVVLRVNCPTNEAIVVI